MMNAEELECVRKSMEKRFYDCVFNDMLTGIVFKFQRDRVIDRMMNIRYDNDEKNQLPPEPVEMYDIFGLERASKKTFECECYICHRVIAATRFAPHMEKCMGIGRMARFRAPASYADVPVRSADTRTRSASVQSVVEEEEEMLTAVTADDKDEEWSNASDTKPKRGGRRVQRRGKKS